MLGKLDNKIKVKLMPFEAKIATYNTLVAKLIDRYSGVQMERMDTLAGLGTLRRLLTT